MRNNMKMILLGMLMAGIICLSGCAQGNKIEMPGKEQFEKGDESDDNSTNSDSTDGDSTDVTTEEGSTNTDNNSTNGETNDNEGDNQSNSMDENTSDNPDNDSSDDEESQKEIDATDDYYGDLINPEDFDPLNYTTDLVFIKPEGDLWRVVDNQGNVFRVSTSYEGLEPGIICQDATVTTDDNGDKKLSLTRSYFLGGDIISKEGSIDEIYDEFVMTLLNRYVNTTNESIKISEFEIDNTQILKTVGKGARVIGIDFKVKPILSVSEWGDLSDSSDDGEWTQVLTTSIVIYGYENSWILPRYNHAFGNDKVELDIVEGEESNEIDTDINETVESDAIIYEDNSFQLYSVEENLPKTEETQDTDIVEYNTHLMLKNKSDGEVIEIYEGLHNGYFYTQTVVDSYVYLLSQSWRPNSEGFPESYFVVDLNTGQVEKLIEGGVVQGLVTDDISYVFTNKYLYEVNLASKETFIVCRLPIDIQLSYDSIVISAIDEQILTVDFMTVDGDYTYTINRQTGVIKE